MMCPSKPLAAVCGAVMIGCIVAVAGCDGPRSYTQPAAPNVNPSELPVYSKDTRTGLCFASQQYSGFNDRTFTNVPCTMGVERLISEQAEADYHRLTSR